MGLSRLLSVTGGPGCGELRLRRGPLGSNRRRSTRRVIDKDGTAEQQGDREAKYEEEHLRRSQHVFVPGECHRRRMRHLDNLLSRTHRRSWVLETSFRRCAFTLGAGPGVEHAHCTRTCTQFETACIASLRSTSYNRAGPADTYFLSI